MNKPTLDALRDIANSYCKGEDIQRVLLEEVLERFICLADEKLTSSEYVPGEDKGTVKILSDLLDRAYKMHVMAGTATYISAQDGDQNDPLLAWLSDVRSVLYGTTKPEPTMRRGGISPNEEKT